MKKSFLLVSLLFSLFALAQEQIETIDDIQLEQIKPNQIKKYWLKMIDNGLAQPVYIPIIVARGTVEKPVLGLTAAIHGNEVNGVAVIQRVLADITIDSLQGTIIAIPGLNGISLPLHQRRYIDNEDLNRNFPGKENGNRTQQYVWNIKTKILSKIDYLIDMHTASFGRENSLYVRAALEDPEIKKMATLQDADIILKNKGVPSATKQATTTRTMRAEAMLMGIPTITVEYGNPQVFQPKMIERGKLGVTNIMSWLRMIPQKQSIVSAPIYCKKSYWIYLDQGGYLELTVALNQIVEAQELIAILRNPFGDIIKKYYAPEKGIVIGKTSNPINMSGGRIIHLGIIENNN
jgi:predicted deacylase